MKVENKHVEALDEKNRIKKVIHVHYILEYYNNINK